jgi:anti-anti-sigma factor
MTPQPDLPVTHPADGVTVVFMPEHGLSEACREVTRQKLFALADSAPYDELRLDFVQVTYLDSSAMALLVALHRRLHESDGNLVLEKLAPYLVELFKLTRLDTVLNIQVGEAGS